MINQAHQRSEIQYVNATQSGSVPVCTWEASRMRVLLALDEIVRVMVLMWEWQRRSRCELYGDVWDQQEFPQHVEISGLRATNAR